MSINTVSAKKIVDLMRAEAIAPSKPLTLTTFASFPDLKMQEQNTKQVYEVLHASLAAAIYAVKDPRGASLQFPLSRRTGFFATILRGSVSADDSQLCKTRLSCYVGPHNRIHFRDPKSFQPYSRCRKSYLSKGSKVLLFNLFREASRRYCPKNLEDEDCSLRDF